MSQKPHNDLAASLQRFGLERDQMRAALAREVKVSSTDLDALEHLEADGPLTQRDLGERLSITSGAVTMLVDRLEASGLVVRRPHPSDRRYVLIELSAKVASEAPAALVAYHTSIRTLVGSMSAEQRGTISAFLKAAADAAGKAAADLHRGAGSAGSAKA